jgi:cell division protein FtsB
MADDTIRLKLQVEGQEQAQTLKNRIEALKAELRDLQNGYQSGYFGREALGPIADLEKQITKTQRELDKLDRAPDPNGKAKGGFQNLGMSVLFVSQAVEDLQYGFSAIVNNIPMIAMSLGAGAGVAGAACLLLFCFLRWARAVREIKRAR